ncbi:MAG: hypothetical protein KJ630_10425 [Proteobacteria bacterium]|nr:hypothetical protein [Pseudomonadota bacterium]
MNKLDEDIKELQIRLEGGSIQRAYRGIVSYMSRLRTVFAGQQGERTPSGIYQGYFDMTYFALFPDTLKVRDLKLAIVFNYETFYFEVWLAARNRKLQKHYWKLFLNAGYNKHSLIEPTVGIDAIVTAVLKEKFSFEDENSLTTQIIESVMAFERDIIVFLNEVDAQDNS